MSFEMTSSSSEMIIGDAFEAVEFYSDSDTDSWQVVDDPYDDVITSDQEESEQQDLVLDDVISSDDEQEEEDDVDDVIINQTQELKEVFDETDDKAAAVELDSLINGEGVEISDGMKEDNMYLEQMWIEHALDEEVHEEVEDEDEDDYNEDEDLDDELVPRWLSNKFEKQRMKKLGKKAYPKMKRSNRMVIRYSRPGCAGAKQNLIW